MRRNFRDEDADVYLAGQLIATLSGYSTCYILELLDAQVAESLKKGKHTLAVHVRQKIGGQGIDVSTVGRR